MTHQEFLKGQYTAMQAVWHKAMNEALCEEVEALRAKVIILEDRLKTLMVETKHD